jgi:hypothetical protein
LLLVGLLLGPGGCAGQSLNISQGSATLPAGEEPVEYVDRISSQTTVSENDAVRGILFLLDGKDPLETFQKRVDALREKKILPAAGDFRAERPITRGKLAYMVHRACKVPGGLTLSLTGPSKRYCLRELQYRGFVSSGPPYGQVAGMEFVAVLARADEYLETGKIPEIMSAAQGQ